MRFFIGLLIGAGLGVGGTYYTLEVANVEPVAAADAGPVAEAKPKKRKKRRKKRRKGKRSKRRVDEVVGDEPLMEAEVAPKLSAEDRTVVWRGASVTLGRRAVDLDGPEARGLNDGEIERVVGPATSRFVRCILSARGQADLRSAVKVKFRVDGRGKVGPVRTQAARYLHDQGLGGCVKGVARGLRFPGTGAPTVVELPFNAQ